MTEEENSNNRGHKNKRNSAKKRHRIFGKEL